MSQGEQLPPDDLLLEVEHLKKLFPVRKAILGKVVAHTKALDDLDAYIKEIIGWCPLDNFINESYGRFPGLGQEGLLQKLRSARRKVIFH